VTVTGQASVVFGDPATFTGTVTSNLPWTAQKWQKVASDNSVSDIDISGDKYTGSSLTGPNPKLQISNTDFTDKAGYRLVVSNGVGSTTSSKITFDVTGGNVTICFYFIHNSM
jgi:hypothetical protein